jgi:hypothetical protein
VYRGRSRNDQSLALAFQRSRNPSGHFLRGSRCILRFSGNSSCAQLFPTFYEWKFLECTSSCVYMCTHTHTRTHTHIYIYIRAMFRRFPCTLTFRNEFHRRAGSFYARARMLCMHASSRRVRALFLVNAIRVTAAQTARVRPAENETPRQTTDSSSFRQLLYHSLPIVETAPGGPSRGRSTVIVPRTSDTFDYRVPEGHPRGSREVQVPSRETSRSNLFIAHLLRAARARGSNCSFEIFPVLRFEYLRRV